MTQIVKPSEDEAKMGIWGASSEEGTENTA
jgi:hypothetical protein